MDTGVNIDCLTYPVLMIDFAGMVSNANAAASVYFGANGTGQLLGISAADAMCHLTRASDGQAVLTTDWFRNAPVGIHCDAVDAKGRELVVSLVPCRDDEGWMLSLSDQTEARLAQRQRDAALPFLTHDLRAPVSSVVALLDLYRFSGSAMTQEELLGRIEGHAHRLLDMVEAFVELTEVGRRVPRLCEVDLVDVTAEAIDEVWEEAKKARRQAVPDRRPLGGRHLLRRARADRAGGPQIAAQCNEAQPIGGACCVGTRAARFTLGCCDQRQRRIVEFGSRDGDGCRYSRQVRRVHRASAQSPGACLAVADAFDDTPRPGSARRRLMEVAMPCEEADPVCKQPGPARHLPS
jgi:hypothetical protein